MRLKIDFAHERQRVPFSYHSQMHAYLHALLGKNSLHGQAHTPLCFGPLTGLMRQGDGLFPIHDRVGWWLGAWDERVIKQAIDALAADKAGPFGFSVAGLSVMKQPDLRNGVMKWEAATPILVKRRREGRTWQYVLWDDPEAGDLLKANLMRSLEANGVDAAVWSVRFDQRCRSAKTKLIDVDGVKVRANVCPVYIDADWQAHAYVWSAGLGWSTGMGFGGLK